MTTAKSSASTSTSKRSESDIAAILRKRIHVGEVEFEAGDVRGVAVRAAARILACAEEGEILVSDTTRVLAQGAGLEFEDRGTHELNGLDGEWRLSAFVDSEVSTE